MAQLLFPGVFAGLITGTKIYENYRDKNEVSEKRKNALKEKQNSMSGDSPSNDHLKKRGYMIAETMTAAGKLGMVSEEYLEKHLKTNSALAGYRDHIRTKYSESRPRLDSTMSTSSVSTLDNNSPLSRSAL